MIRIEGENRIDIAAVVNWLAEKYNVPDRTALRWLCTVISYDVVTEAITAQIDYLLNEKVLKNNDGARGSHISVLRITAARGVGKIPEKLAGRGVQNIRRSDRRDKTVQ